MRQKNLRWSHENKKTLGIILLNVILMCSCSTGVVVEDYIDGRKKISGLLINGKKEGSFIITIDHSIVGIDYYHENKIYKSLELFEGNIIIEEIFENDTLVKKHIVNYDYYLKRMDLYHNSLENSFDAGRKIFINNCMMCHFKINSNYQDIGSIGSDLIPQMRDLIRVHRNFNKFNLMEQDTMKHSAFIHLDTSQINNIYFFLK